MQESSAEEGALWVRGYCLPLLSALAEHQGMEEALRISEEMFREHRVGAALVSVLHR